MYKPWAPLQPTLHDSFSRNRRLATLPGLSVLERQCHQNFLQAEAMFHSDHITQLSCKAPSWGGLWSPGPGESGAPFPAEAHRARALGPGGRSSQGGSTRLIPTRTMEAEAEGRGISKLLKVTHWPRVTCTFLNLSPRPFGNFCCNERRTWPTLASFYIWVFKFCQGDSLQNREKKSSNILRKYLKPHRPSYLPVVASMHKGRAQVPGGTVTFWKPERSYHVASEGLTWSNPARSILLECYPT